MYETEHTRSRITSYRHRATHRQNSPANWAILTLQIGMDKQIREFSLLFLDRENFRENSLQYGQLICHQALRVIFHTNTRRVFAHFLCKRATTATIKERKFNSIHVSLIRPICHVIHVIGHAHERTNTYGHIKHFRMQEKMKFILDFAQLDFFFSADTHLNRVFMVRVSYVLTCVVNS